MSIGNLILGVNSVAVSYLIHYDSLLPNATDIITNVTAILLQNATEIYYKMCQIFYYKMRQFYYKMWVITNCDDFIIKCDIYYKFRQYDNIQTTEPLC